MLTPDAVIAALEREGYAVTPRRLTDWRQKGLLPPLVKRGLGQGQGWVYLWDDPNVVDQAMTVQELLWMHERTGWLHVPLWCLGFDVPLERVRSQLLTKLEQRQAQLIGGNEDPAAVADNVSALALEEATRPGPRRRRRRSADVFEYWLNLLAGDTDYSPGWDDWEQLAGEFVRFMGWTKADATRSGTRLASPAGLRLIRRWARQYAAVPRLVEAARHASEHEWAAVHADWQALARLTRILSTLAEEETWEEFHSLGLRVVAIAGPWVSLVDLSMRRRGQGHVWDEFRHGLMSSSERLERDPDLRDQVRRFWADARAVTDAVN